MIRLFQEDDVPVPDKQSAAGFWLERYGCSLHESIRFVVKNWDGSTAYLWTPDYEVVDYSMCADGDTLDLFEIDDDLKAEVEKTVLDLSRREKIYLVTEPNARQHIVGERELYEFSCSNKHLPLDEFIRVGRSGWQNRNTFFEIESAIAIDLIICIINNPPLH